MVTAASRYKSTRGNLLEFHRAARKQSEKPDLDTGDFKASNITQPEQITDGWRAQLNSRVS
jgi:hypothetical protein